MTSLYRVNFELADNEDLHAVFALSDSAGAPVDLTGADLRMTIAPLDRKSTLDLSLANGRITLIDPILGQFELAAAATIMKSLSPGVYRHDLLVRLADRTQRIWEGTLVLVQGVTE